MDLQGLVPFFLFKNIEPKQTLSVNSLKTAWLIPSQNFDLRQTREKCF